MKKVLGPLLAVFAVPVWAQFTPGQVLTAAQLNSQFALYAPLSGAVFSGPVTTPTLTVTGSAVFPAGTIALAGLAAQAANTVVANTTGISATPTAVGIPSCSGSTNALKYTSGTGFTCGLSFGVTGSPLSQFAATTSAQLAGVISDETGSGSLVFGTGPTITGGSINNAPIGATTASTGAFTTLAASTGINGSTSASSPACNSGFIGALCTSTSTATSITTSGTPQAITSISLPAGHWDVQCTSAFSSATAISSLGVGINSSSGVLTGVGTFTNMGLPWTASFGSAIASPTVDVSQSATTTWYCNVAATFTGSMTATVYMRARRTY